VESFELSFGSGNLPMRVATGQGCISDLVRHRSYLGREVIAATQAGSNAVEEQAAFGMWAPIPAIAASVARSAASAADL
jgi:hypothetical protein